MDLVSRAKNICLSPAAEWRVIEGEPATPASLLTGYALPLASIGAIAAFVGTVLFGGMFGVYRPSILFALVNAVFSVAIALVMCVVLGLIIDALAPTFGSTKDPLKAFKVAAYYPTAAWLAGALLLIPGIGIIVMLVGAIYSLYLLYVGLPILMKTPADKQVGYFVAVLVVAIVVLGIINVITNRIIYSGMF